jgi:hypothetical protein
MAALTMTVVSSVAYAAGTDLVIYHSWSTPSEMAALNVLKS